MHCEKWRMSFRSKEWHFFYFLEKIDIDLIQNTSYYIFKEEYDFNLTLLNVIWKEWEL